MTVNRFTLILMTPRLLLCVAPSVEHLSIGLSVSLGRVTYLQNVILMADARRGILLCPSAFLRFPVGNLRSACHLAQPSITRAWCSARSSGRSFSILARTLAAVCALRILSGNKGTFRPFALSGETLFKPLNQTGAFHRAELYSTSVSHDANMSTMNSTMEATRRIHVYKPIFCKNIT